MSFNEFERLSGGGRDDDLFGKANDFSNGLSRNKDEKTKRLRRPLPHRNSVEFTICAFLDLQ